MSVLQMMMGRQPAGGGGFSDPSDIAGLRTWLAADSLGLSDGAAIATFTDQSPAGINATQGTAVNRPTYKTGIINGLAVARFDGDDFMPFASHPLTGATAGTLFTVHKINADPPASGGNAATPAGKWGSAADDDHWPFTDGNIYTSWGSTVRKNTGNPTLSMASFRIFSIVSAASDWRMYLAGGTPHFSTSTNTVGWAGVPSLGANGGAQRLLGDVAEVIAYDSALSNADLNAVGGYLATKYALTWSAV